MQALYRNNGKFELQPVNKGDKPVCRFWEKDKAIEAMNKLNGDEPVLIEIGREIYGGCGKLSDARRAINRHSVRYYLNNNGEIFTLDRTVDCEPKCFDVYYRFYDLIILPSLTKWFDGVHAKSWKAAEKKLYEFVVWLNDGGWDKIDEETKQKAS